MTGADAAFALAVHLYQAGRPEEAVADFSSALEADPEFTGVYFNRALAYDELGESAAALADYERFLELYQAEDRLSFFANERLAALKSK